MQDMMKSPCQLGSRHGDGLWLIQPWLVVLVLFSLAAGDDDRGSAEDEHDAGHVVICRYDAV